MLQSIRNFAKGKLSKVLLVVLIIPFVLWGMGDVFRGGSQSTIATLNKKKISITDYIDHFNFSKKIKITILTQLNKLFYNNISIVK